MDGKAHKRRHQFQVQLSTQLAAVSYEMGFQSGLAFLSLVLLLAPSHAQYQQDPDRSFQEQDPDRFHMEQDPDSFRMEQDPDRFRMEQDPDRHLEQDPDRRLEQQDPDRRLEQQDPDRRLEDDDDFRLEQDPDRRLEDDDDYRLEQDPDRRLEDDDDYRLEQDPDRRLEDNDDYMEDDDSYRLESRAMGENYLLRELAMLQKEDHTKPPTKSPPKKAPKKVPKKAPKKVTFEEHTDVAEMMRWIENEDVSIESLDDDDDALSQLVMVTSEGYEFEQDQEDYQESRGMVMGSEYSEDSSPYEAHTGATQAGLEISTNATGQRVFGRDTRRRIYNPLYRYPWRAMGRVDVGCSGVFIGPRHILTAGHCVFNPYTRRWRRNLNFRRGKNCSPNQGVLYRWKNAVTTRGWVNGNRRYDYAVIVVHTSSPTWMSFGWRYPMPRYIVNTAGYPVDKPRQCMWHTHCQLLERYHTYFTYQCDTYGGMSGSPVYALFRGSRGYYRVVYGIHTGVSRWRHRNIVTRINKRRYIILHHIMRRYR